MSVIIQSCGWLASFGLLFIVPLWAFGLELHTVPISVKSYRLLAMSMDEDGFIWVGSVHDVIHRYDPRTGQVEDIRLPDRATASACICVGKKVYILGQAHPALLIYDRQAKKFSKAKYPSERPDVWYGTSVIDDRHLYLFDRGSVGVIKWDTQKDTGNVIAYPYKTPLPGSGQYAPADKALWCHIWDMSKGQYVPLGLARLDLAANRFTDFVAFPNEDAGLKPFTDAKTTLFLPYSLNGKLVPFDFQQKRWCQFLTVPRYGELFGFIGGPTTYKGKLYFSLSTYTGTDTGCDGKPYHFCNALLEFDPRTQRFDFPKLAAKDAYYQIAYTLSAGGEFFATGSNIRDPSGQLNRDRKGEIVFWQTIKPQKKKGP